jgi:glycosyltransferase involved in cell wall biosynthesis
LEENSGKLIKLYPDYLARVQEFIDADLPKPIRKFASLILISASSSKKPILIVDHQVGGSANFYRKQMVQDCINSGQAVLLLTFDAERQEMNLQALYKEYSEIFKIWKPEDLSILAKYIELSEICLNNLVTYPDPLSVIEVILQLKHIFNSRLKILFHDHYALCPSYTLLDHNGIYCNLPIENICNICLPKNDYRIPNNLHNEINISKWRKVWSNLLSNADEIICFSKSSQILLQRIYNLKNELVSIQPHKFISPFSKKPKLDFNMPLCIGVVGGINYQKGSQMVLDVAKIIAIKHPEIKIVIIGSLEIANKLPNLILAGPYQPSELPDLIEKYQINLCFFSSIIPETFSYVTSELIELEVPICAFDIGAQAERVGEYKFGHIISKIDAETALSEMIAYYSQLKK